jgi:pimeloyl-ACP methyl ester carboxylesterase
LINAECGVTDAATDERRDDDMTAPLFIDVDGITTRYFEAGHKSSPTLVLIHGGDYDYREVASATEWLVNFGPLSSAFHVFAFDKIGCGQTDNPVAALDYTITSVVAHARKLLELLALSDIIVWGHSRGALAALRLAIEVPEHVSNLVITNSNSAAPEDPTVPRSFYTRFYSSEDAIATPETLRQLFAALAFDPTNPRVEAVYRRKLKELKAPHPARPMTSSAIRSMLNFKKQHFETNLIDYKYKTLDFVRAGRLRAPTLVLWGFNDPTVSARVGFDLYQRLALYASKTEFHIVNGVGHYPHLEDPDSVHRVILSFAGQPTKSKRASA